MKQTISTLKRSLAVLAVFLAATGLAQAEYLYVANAGDNTIEKFSSSGADLGVFTSANLNGPVALAFDNSGNFTSRIIAAPTQLRSLVQPGLISASSPAPA